MIYRGFVLSLDREYAVVITEEAKYIKVNKKNGLVVGTQILFLKDDVYKEKRTTPLYLLKYAAVFAILLFATVFQPYIDGIQVKDNTAAAVLTIDINPSLEIEINREESVISIVSLNEDGAVISNRRMLGQPIDTVISTLLKNAEKEKYLNSENDFVLISITPLIDELNMSLADIEDDISDVITGSNNLDTINVVYTSGDRSSLEEARLNKISAGKYYLYEELRKTEPSITIEFIKTLELKDLANRQRYGQGYGEQSEAASRRMLSEDAYEHILLRERSRIQKGFENINIDAENGSRSRSSKGSVLKHENQSMDIEKTQPGEESDENMDIQSGRNSGEPQKNYASDENQQYQLQNQKGDLKESEEKYDGEAITPENAGSEENKNTGKGKESYTGSQDNNSSNEENRK